jgi:hypothetical protein
MTRLGPSAGKRRLQPNERVVVIAEDQGSGATIGYYGTVVRVHTSSMRHYPSNPALWKYSVHVENLQDCIDVAATSLFATGEVSDAGLPCENDRSKPVIEIRFHHSLIEDNTEVHGAYRLPQSEWRLFRFRKSEVSRPSYQLSVPIPDELSRVGELEFQIPLWLCLDKSYVFQALSEVHGIVRSPK